MMEVFTVDRLLLLLNSYSALFFASLAVMTVCFTEPFVHLQSNFQDGYVGFQLFLAVMYTMNALVHIYAALSSGWMWANNLYSEEQATLIPLSVFMRVTFLVISGKFYAQAVWYPAMMDKPPLVVTSHLYILLFGMYFVMLLLPDVEESGTKKRVYETEDGPDEVRNTEE
ncbi:hypothetical protein CYMTET_39765 [Cymbomonas tetramitiformis]|uniref:Uncharacterized protein n=1 Tax=Cymbomonas tetramitiformis TaxID=36881 RepID=A0AAE0F3M8_9CHLO|nr:hypothetical protein CYMTET_39765 [Cymbomonas tetramitiformis]